jgi:AMIN domain
LTPADVTESQDRPRRLVLDFPNVLSRAPTQTNVEGQLVTRVRVGVNSREPLVTRVVMEVAEGATYHVERAGTSGSDLAVVFEPQQSSKTVLVATPLAGARRAEPEPDIPLEQAIANAASLTPKEIPA